jgi:hypothetical protein
MPQAWTYDLFISAVDADKGWVEGYLISELEKAEIRCISESDFNLGVPRINEFERVIQQSRYTLLVISQAYLADDLTRFTDILAQSYGEQVGTWPVIPLTLQEGLQLPPRLKMLKGLKATTSAQWEAALESLCSQFQHPVPQPSPPPACPYPGMKEFREDDEQRFFGRDEEIEDLLGRLHLHPFLTVIGPSGSGKSSLVFAGLIPKLKQSGLFGTGQWCIHSFRPGTSPLANLQAVLGGDVTDLEVRIQQLLSTQPDARRLLLVVNQFEELFTQAGSEAILFQQGLLKLLEIPNVYLILTVRADFYPDLMVSLLWEKIRSHRFEVLPLDRKRLQQAIVRPAEGVEVYIDSALVERLLVDAQGEPGVLPLLQETLVILWEKLERHFLPLTAYELLVLPRPAYGATPTHPRTGLQVAIAYRADAAFADLETEEKQAIARRIFLRLVQFGEGRADTRRQQPIEALQAMGDDPVLFQNTLNHLVNSRLLTLSGEEKAEKSRKVDIAHEALISGWPTFQQWIRDRRNSEEIRRRSIEKVTEWIRLGRGAGGLLDPVELAEAEQWLTSSDAVDLGNDEALSELMAASRVAIQTTLKAEQRRNQDGTTIYSFPCNLGHKNGIKAIVTWEVKGTTKRACESGMRVTSSDRGNSRISHHSFQPFEVAALKDISLSKLQASDTVRSNKELSIALTSDDTRYYCSALANAGQRGRGIGFGETSIDESCDNAIKECRESSNGSDCALITMGEWSVNDPELLMMSLTCGGGKPSSKKVSGSDVNINILVNTLLGDLVGGWLGLKPETCFLDVYHPDEIIISPVDNQKTVVESSDVGADRLSC